MRRGELSGGERADDRQLTGERERRGHFRERKGVSGSGEAENLETRLLRRQRRAASHRADDQIRQRHRDVEGAVGSRLEARDPDRRFGDRRRILSAGDEQRRQPVRVVSLDADASAHHAAECRHARIIHQRVRGRVQPPFDQFGRQHDLGAQLLAAHAHERMRRCLLVAGHVRLDVPRASRDRRVLDDVAADGFRRDRRHVLTGRIAGLELEPEVDVVSLDGELHVHELPVPRGLGRDGPERFHAPRRPRDERRRLRQRVERKPRRTADALVQHERRAAARLGHELRAARVGGDERRFARRERHVEIPVRMYTVDPQRTREPHGNFDGADEVLDVAGVPLALLHRPRVGQLRARRGREPRQRPAPRHRVLADLAAAGHAGRHRIVTRLEACRLFEAARAAGQAEIVEDSPVMRGHVPQIDAPRARRTRQGVVEMWGRQGDGRTGCREAASVPHPGVEDGSNWSGFSAAPSPA